MKVCELRKTHEKEEIAEFNIVFKNIGVFSHKDRDVIGFWDWYYEKCSTMPEEARIDFDTYVNVWNVLKKDMAFGPCHGSNISLINTGTPIIYTTRVNYMLHAIYDYINFLDSIDKTERKPIFLRNIDYYGDYKKNGTEPYDDSEWQEIYKTDTMVEFNDLLCLVGSLCHGDKYIIDFWRWYYKHNDCWPIYARLENDEYTYVMDIISEEVLKGRAMEFNLTFRLQERNMIYDKITARSDYMKDIFFHQYGEYLRGAPISANRCVKVLKK